MPNTHAPEPATRGDAELGYRIEPEEAESLHLALERANQVLVQFQGTGVPLTDLVAAVKESLSRLHLGPKAVPAPALAEILAALTSNPQLEVASAMLRSVEALGPALSEVPSQTSPQLARSMQATENTWRRMELEFGLLSSLEVSDRVGSRKPNRSYASDQHSKGRLIAVKRPGGLRYPGFQIDPREQRICPAMEDLIRVAREAGISETSLALWMCSPTGYLDGDRPVDRLDQPEVVTEAAQHAFNVQW